MKLRFPESGEELSDAFNNALDAGVMDRDSGSRKFWARHELIASDVEDGEVVADWFLNPFSDVFIRVPRKDNST